MLDKLTQLHKSKFFKCFLIAIVLVFSYEVSKPKAFVPLAWAGAVLAGMAAEQLITMGVKAVSKQALKKKADDYAAQAAKDGNFDFMGTNPYLNKDGSLTLSPSANDRAKMAGLISGGLIGMATEDLLSDDPAACNPDAPTGSLLPIVVESGVGGNFKQTYFATATPYSTGRGAEILIYNRVSLKIVEAFGYGGGTAKELRVTSFSGSYYNYAVEFVPYDGSKPFDTTGSLGGNTGLTSIQSKSYTNATSAGASLIGCDGLVFPSTVDRVYPAPMDMSSAYQMPNHNEIVNNDITINNVMPPTDTAREITWAEIENHYNTTGDSFEEVMDSNIDNYLANGDINNTPITIGEINNYYTDINYPEKVEDFNPPLEIPEPELPDEPDPDDNLPAKPVDQLDHSMWQVMRNTYNYLDDGIDSSLAAMKGITDSASGITNYLGQTMGWLPAEWRAVFTSAFVLGVFAHFLRR